MADATKQRDRRTSPAGRIAAAVLLAALPAIVLGIYLTGRGGGAPVPARPAGEATPGLMSLLPLPPADSTFKITTPPREWPAKRMYEKIDGEDVVYLRHGCTALAAMTLTSPNDANTIDVYLYRMGGPAGAEAVFAEQAPPDDAPDPADRPAYVDLGDRAYLSYGCCYLRAGPFYLKLIAGSQTPAVRSEVLALARRFVQGLKANEP